MDAPIKQRYLRFKEKYGNQKSVGIEEFVELDDMVSVILYAWFEIRISMFSPWTLGDQ